MYILSLLPFTAKTGALDLIPTHPNSAREQFAFRYFSPRKNVKSTTMKFTNINFPINC